MSVEDKMKKIIAEKLSVSMEEIVPEASFVDDLGADSLDLVELIMSMEEEFDTDISDEDARAVFQDHIDQQWDAGKIKDRLGGAAAWAEKHGVAIGCGEFGVYRTYANPVDRARYLRDIRMALEHYGIGWTQWDYKGSFSLLEEGTTSPKVDEPIAEALGLPAIQGDN